MNNTQVIRLVGDVILIGPFLIVVGSIFPSLPISIRLTLIFLGILIILYNGYNFVRVERSRNV